MTEQSERFKDNMDLELALRNLMGERCYGLAGAFSDPLCCKEFLLRAIKQIRKRLKEVITTDERLSSTTHNTLDSLEHYAKSTSEKVNNDWFIIADLLNLISRLLGYDYLDGKVHRYIIFYQDKQQEFEDYHKNVGRALIDELSKDLRVRYELVYLLKKKEFSNNQIARVMGLSEKLVIKILKKIQNFERNTGEEFLKYLS